MITFKIVRKMREGLFSIGTSDYTLQYEIGKTAFAKIGKIYVFKFIEDVKEWMESNDLKGLEPVVRDQFIVIRGEADNLTKPKGVAFIGIYENSTDYYQFYGFNSTLTCVNSSCIKDFWTAKQKHKLTNSFPPPNHTYTCSSFTPICLSNLKGDIK